MKTTAEMIISLWYSFIDKFCPHQAFQAAIRKELIISIDLGVKCRISLSGDMIMIILQTLQYIHAAQSSCESDVSERLLR